MNMNSLGRLFRVTIFGESHGKVVGVTVDGCPPGLEIREEEIQKDLDRRRPGQSDVSTTRKEEDRVEILSGVFNGLSTGSPLTMIIRNKDVDSSTYEKIKNTPRPGHADFTAFVRYAGFNDYRGGGMFSGRMTASLVMAGAIAKKILEEEGISILSQTVQIGNVKGEKKMEELIKKAKEEKDSVGGIVECEIKNVPAGLGDPFFDTLEGEIAKGMFSIPAVKGIEFGKGFELAEMRGFESNDTFIIREGKILTETNNSGGINGGISNGMSIKFRIVFKPTSSIARKQKTVDLEKMEETEITIEGRHDPCIVPRAVPVVESVSAIVIADHLMRWKAWER